MENFQLRHILPDSPSVKKLGVEDINRIEEALHQACNYSCVKIRADEPCIEIVKAIVSAYEPALSVDDIVTIALLRSVK